VGSAKVPEPNTIPLEYDVINGLTQAEVERELATRHHIRLEIEQFGGAIREWISIQLIKKGYAWQGEKLLFKGSCLFHGQLYVVTGWYAPAAEKKGEIRF
jgi:hypothetical protein